MRTDTDTDIYRVTDGTSMALVIVESGAVGRPTMRALGEESGKPVYGLCNPGLAEVVRRKRERDK